MSVEFQEYKGKRKPINPRHKFPLLRLIFLALAAFAVYWSGLPSKIADALPLPGNEVIITEKTWDQKCVAAGGIPESYSDSEGRENPVAECVFEILEERVDSLVLPNAFLRYIASLRKNEHMKIVWVAPVKDFSNPIFVRVHDRHTDEYLHVMKSDSSYVWVRMSVEPVSPMTSDSVEAVAQGDARRGQDDGCRFPGVCPHMPLQWSALPISEGFDFEGQESLIAADVFRGIGEAPVHAVLPGRVLDLGKDSLGHFVEIDHGNNITSRTSGLGLRNEKLSQGDSVQVDVPIGKLAPMDSAVFYLSVRENGRFVRWKDFYEDAYPVSEKEISNFLDNQMRLLDRKSLSP